MKRFSDLVWLSAWVGGLSVLVVWDLLFLNRPACARIAQAFGNTLVVALSACLFTLAAGWVATMVFAFAEKGAGRPIYLVVVFIANLIRSIPQVVGILLGYTFVTFAALDGMVTTRAGILVLISLVISIFMFLELSDLMRERIGHFRRSDFFDAMQVCGIGEFRIVNFDILWKCSRVHILNKLISVFAMAVFLQCSVDFVISVGLSTSISQVNLPVTLGSMLARIDSKQDILAIGHSLTHPAYSVNLFFTHLQGVSVAFLIVFTLVCLFNVGNAFARRHRL